MCSGLWFRSIDMTRLGIYHWPTSTIEKNILIRKLEELCRQNPELEHIYENIPITSSFSSTFNSNTAVQSRPNVGENFLSPMTSANDGRRSRLSSPHVTLDRGANAKDGDPIPNLILVKGGDLRVKKGIFSNRMYDEIHMCLFQIHRFYRPLLKVSEPQQLSSHLLFISNFRKSIKIYCLL